ncbi:F-box/FBD/LRR-repeat protein At5g56420-like [Syzygium oleosum]|uniref:F-box/FBD/LRR-repeat protein At5g56420-like n=1 Tax=Syzygium oleosum TaxID=219896 RepID=UPI0024BBBDB4|nr:F-box/FBD/LRR-repeat protein At5g56420-like [Syzygium oleosum]
MNDGAFRAPSIRKLNEEQDMDAVICNIGDLPEAILEHILSIVPMEDAVRTCVLSKKWLSGPLILILYYASGAFPGGSILPTSRKEYFSEAPLAQNEWNVEECSVSLSEIPGNSVLPQCLFTCATLTRLKLFISGALKLPSRIWLPNLKLLDLMEITFVDERSTEQLLSSPMLEELTITNCNWDNLEIVTIRAPMLKILTIIDEDFDYSSLHPHSCRVLIYS